MKEEKFKATQGLYVMYTLIFLGLFIFIVSLHFFVKPVNVLLIFIFGIYIMSFWNMGQIEKVNHRLDRLGL